ncbi:cytochrome c oxidase assembly protein COX16-domain-containing protein [Zychaea mexicana]|uniref:cytochrome c oxidase assembly protein COX16-domain-containing protein n=1 Tax=Zychaea mexicana TaxID=64656 RepID=UPI0022FE7D73|nr:cytochrome c oxidase assembly protein COX16-domain-containing protein [Zychaea mexicana]KAI9494005.1 cytochrome c oxidase assembly protein COX16-domain-containing protein [Zychaea mexicana]
MPATFQSKPYGKKSALDPLAAKVKKRPFILFGLPFIAIIVGGSFGLSQLTQTRYDHRDMRHRKVAKEEALGMDQNRRKLSLQEEYWRLQAKTEEDWDQVRIDRPEGVE